MKRSHTVLQSCLMLLCFDFLQYLYFNYCICMKYTNAKIWNRCWSYFILLSYFSFLMRWINNNQVVYATLHNQCSFPDIFRLNLFFVLRYFFRITTIFCVYQKLIVHLDLLWLYNKVSNTENSVAQQTETLPTRLDNYYIIIQIIIPVLLRIHAQTIGWVYLV